MTHPDHGARPTFDELYDQHWHAQHGVGRMGVHDAYATGDAAPARWSLVVPLVIISAITTTALICWALVAFWPDTRPAGCEAYRGGEVAACVEERL